MIKQRNIIKYFLPLVKEQINKYSKYFEGLLSDSDVMKFVDIARNSYYKYKKGEK